MDDNKQRQLSGQGVTNNTVSRRRLVKGLIGGVSALGAYYALPVKWSTPILEEIVLPAHAQTSAGDIDGLFRDPCAITLSSGNTTSSSVSIRVDGFITAPIGGIATQIIATPRGAGNPETVDTATQPDGTFGADITITGGPGITDIDVRTTVDGAETAANCSISLDVPDPGPGPDPEPDPGPYIASFETYFVVDVGDTTRQFLYISGVVVDGDGNPLASREVTVGATADYCDGTELPQYPPDREATTPADGSFEVIFGSFAWKGNITLEITISDEKISEEQIISGSGSLTPSNCP